MGTEPIKKENRLLEIAKSPRRRTPSSAARLCPVAVPSPT